jgi:hypothetical protein
MGLSILGSGSASWTAALAGGAVISTSLETIEERSGRGAEAGGALILFLAWLAESLTGFIVHFSTAAGVGGGGGGLVVVMAGKVNAVKGFLATMVGGTTGGVGSKSIGSAAVTISCPENDRAVPLFGGDEATRRSCASLMRVSQINQSPIPRNRLAAEAVLPDLPFSSKVFVTAVAVALVAVGGAAVTGAGAESPLATPTTTDSLGVL